MGASLTPLCYRIMIIHELTLGEIEKLLHCPKVDRSILINFILSCEQESDAPTERARCYQLPINTETSNAILKVINLMYGKRP